MRCFALLVRMNQNPAAPRASTDARLLATGVQLLLAASLGLEGVHAGAADAGKHISAKKFDALADAALAAMKKRAAELKTTGVAVVSFAEGDSVQGWSSKMAVV